MAVSLEETSGKAVADDALSPSAWEADPAESEKSHELDLHGLGPRLDVTVLGDVEAAPIADESLEEAGVTSSEQPSAVQDLNLTNIDENDSPLAAATSCSNSIGLEDGESVLDAVCSAGNEEPVIEVELAIGEDSVTDENLNPGQDSEDISAARKESLTAAERLHKAHADLTEKFKVHAGIFVENFSHNAHIVFQTSDRQAAHDAAYRKIQDERAQESRAVSKALQVTLEALDQESGVWQNNQAAPASPQEKSLKPLSRPTSMGRLQVTTPYVPEERRSPTKAQPSLRPTVWPQSNPVPRATELLAPTPVSSSPTPQIVPGLLKEPTRGATLLSAPAPYTPPLPLPEASSPPLPQPPPVPSHMRGRPAPVSTGPRPTGSAPPRHIPPSPSMRVPTTSRPSTSEAPRPMPVHHTQPSAQPAPPLSTGYQPRHLTYVAAQQPLELIQLPPPRAAVTTLLRSSPAPPSYHSRFQNVPGSRSSTPQVSSEKSSSNVGGIRSEPSQTKVVRTAQAGRLVAPPSTAVVTLGFSGPSSNVIGPKGVVLGGGVASGNVAGNQWQQFLEGKGPGPKAGPVARHDRAVGPLRHSSNSLPGYGNAMSAGPGAHRTSISSPRGFSSGSNFTGQEGGYVSASTGGPLSGGALSSSMPTSSAVRALVSRGGPAARFPALGFGGRGH